MRDLVVSHTARWPTVGFLVILTFSPALAAQAAIPVFSKVSPSAVLKPTVTWEGQTIVTPSVIFDGGKFKAWYSAGNSLSDGTFIGSIGYATSNDGISWTKYENNPVLSPGAGWDQVSAALPSVSKLGNQYFMYYRGWNGDSSRIGLATSNDGISWTKFSGNPLPLPGTEPYALYSNGQWNLWWLTQGRIGYATSSDGTSWSVVSADVKLKIPSGYNNAYSPMVTFAGGLYNMWFSSDSSSGSSRLSYATSSDEATWTTYSDNPLAGENGNAWSASVVTAGQTTYLWYQSDDGVYLATTTTPIPEFSSTLTLPVLLLAGLMVLVFLTSVRIRKRT